MRPVIKFQGKIPISISNFFWLTAAFIGWMYSRSLVGTLIWVGIIFVSILIHELGHALTAKFFGQKPRIELIAFGGLTYPSGPKLPLWKEFIVVFNGPLFGFSLFILGTLLLQVPALATPGIGNFLQTFRLVNLFWTVVNLLPVLPLDGGQLVRIICESIFHSKGFRYALMISMIVAIVISLTFFFMRGFLIGAFFFLFAFQNFEAWRKTKGMSDSDKSDSLKGELAKVEAQLRSGNRHGALEKLVEIRSAAKSGMIFARATEYLAGLKYSDGETQEAYDLLISVKKHLLPESTLLLQKVAFDAKDYKLAAELSGKCFQLAPTADVAIRSAMASAEMQHVKSTIGWLQAALKEGLVNVDAVISKPHFEKVKTDPVFQKFIHKGLNN